MSPNKTQMIVTSRRSRVLNHSTPVSNNRSFSQKPTNADKLVTGTDNSKLKVAPKKVFSIKLFATGLALETTRDDMKSYLYDNLKFTFEEKDIHKRLTKYPTYSSFVITTAMNHINTLLDGSKWPDGTSLKRFYDPKVNLPKETGDILQTKNILHRQLLQMTPKDGVEYFYV